MSTFVIDCSVVAGWLLRSQSTAYTEAVAARLKTTAAIAPALLPLEYTNVLRTACRRGKLMAAEAQVAIAALARLPITIETTTPRPAALLSLALRHDLSIYDAVYLDLALEHSLPIATQDEALAHAARAAGVGVLA